MAMAIGLWRSAWRELRPSAVPPGLTFSAFWFKYHVMNRKKVGIFKSVRLGKKSQMVLPKEVRDWLGVEEGQSVVFHIGEDGVKLVTPAEFVKSTLGEFKGAWGKDPEKYLRDTRSGWDRPSVP